MAESRHGPAQPGASNLGEAARGRVEEFGRTQEEAQVPESGQGEVGGHRPEPPPERSDVSNARISSLPILPPPLRSAGSPSQSVEGAQPLKGTDETRDKQAKVDDPRTREHPRGPAPVLPELDAVVEVDEKSTSADAISGDPSHVQAEGSPRDDIVASAGPGESARPSVAGSSVDGPNKNETLLPAPARELLGSPANRLPIPRTSSSPGKAALSPAWLVVRSGNDRGRRFVLKSGRTSVGRGIDNDVVLADIAVSRKHLTIEFDGSNYILNDVGSGNGTQVNDQDEDGPVRLRPGDVLKLGNTVLGFEGAGAQAHSDSVRKWPIRREDGDLGNVAGRRAGQPPLAGGGAKEAPSNSGGLGPITLRGEIQVRRVPTPAPARSGAAPRITGATRARPPIPIPPDAVPMTGEPSSVPWVPSDAEDSEPPASSGVRSAFGSYPPPYEASGSADIPFGNRSTLAPMAGRFSRAAGRSREPFIRGTSPPGTPEIRPLTPSQGPLAHPAAASTSILPAPNRPASPSFQFPNGVMVPLPGSGRGRLVIGVLGIAFVAAGAGIILALVQGREEERARGAYPAVTEKAATVLDSRATSQRGTSAPVAAISPLPAQPGQDATRDVRDPAGDDLQGEDKGALLPNESGTSGSAQEVPAGVAGAASQSEPPRAAVPPPGEQAIAKPPRPVHNRARLTARERRQRRRDLRRRMRASLTAVNHAGDDATSKVGVASTDPEGPPRVASTDPEGAPRAASTDPESPRRDARPSIAVRASTAPPEAQAESLYKQKRFDEAAAVLRRAANAAGGKEGRRLRILAINYGKVGELLAEGQSSLVSDAPHSLEAFKAALRLDEEFGDSEHDRTIGAHIAEVAPAAAAAYMARKEYAEAKTAADLAEKFGAGDSDRVHSVRTSLERRAAELYQEARSQVRAGENEQAAETARLILRMVSRSSDLYSQAAKLVAP